MYLRNYLVAQLRPELWERVRPHAETVKLDFGEVLHPAARQLEYVWFPNDGDAVRTPLEAFWEAVDHSLTQRACRWLLQTRERARQRCVLVSQPTGDPWGWYTDLMFAGETA